MGLLDGYFDPDQFGEGGGLLGRLLALQPQHAQYQQGASFDPPPSAPQTPAPLPWPTSADNRQTPSASQTPAPDLHSQYQALRPMLGDRHAMLATVHPEVGQALVAQALAGQQRDSTANVVQAGYRLGGIPLPPMPVPAPPIPMPAIPDWLKDFGAVLQMYRKGISGRRSSRDDGEDECDKRLWEETSRCDARYDEYAHPDFLHGCKDRAKNRWRLCVSNGRRFPPSEPAEWGPDDEEIWRNYDR